MSEWTSKKLSDIVLFNPKETLKKGSLAPKISMDILQPFCRDIPTYELAEYNGGTKFRNGDTIMARITPCLENGKTSKVGILSKNEIGFGSTEYIVFRAINGVTDEDFVYYLVCSPLIREPAIKSMVGSSGRQRVQTDVLQNLVVSIPDLLTQHKIGSILKSIDDKIELNNKINDKLSVEDNIKNTYLNPTSFLFEEPTNLLKQEVREPAIYTAIITAIATGASRMSEISTKVGEDTNVCTSYIKNLMNLGIVQKETPYGEKNSRKSIYYIEDNMFRFWYRFVLENNSIIVRGAADRVYKRIEPYLSNYMGKVFEDICTQYLWKLLLDGRCPVEFNSLGRWWGTDPVEKKQTEIDIMGVQDKDTALFGECKWTNEKIDLGVLDTLVKRSRLFSYTNVHYYLFSKSGFTKGCSDKAEEMGSVTLVDYAEIAGE